MQPSPQPLRHVLTGITLSKRLRKQLLVTDPTAPMAAAVRLRAGLMDLGFDVLLMSPIRMMIASLERRNRLVVYPNSADNSVDPKTR
jgi:hypothetical protein